MPRLGRLIAIWLLVAFSLARGDAVVGWAPTGGRGAEPDARSERGAYPNDWFGMQRAFPGVAIDQAAYRTAVERVLAERARSRLATTVAPPAWTPVGPFNIGGRVTALVSTPGGGTVYLGAADGGVFKSTNGGINWTPSSDGLGSLSIGALALDPQDPSTIYCGTGESNAAVDNYDGAGLFRSVNGGQTWTYLGLEATRRIAAVVVDPSNSSRIFVAAMGAQFSTNPERGLYRSENGGQSFSQVLFVSDSTGACDVQINPAHPETVYCATWERIRRPTYRRSYGPECGIWRSIDHGTTWTRLSNGLPAPSDNVGRIGLALAPSWPSVVYAQIISGPASGQNGLGLYRTQDGGANWQLRTSGSPFSSAFGGFGWYFGEFGVDPTNASKVYAMGVDLLASSDGGVTFGSILGTAHVDQHAIWIDPSNPSRIYLGNDGGFYSTTNGGGAWTKSLDLPITQFYAGTIDPSNAARLLGGAQDNNSLQTSGGASAWSAILGGDGFYCLVDPTNSNVVFAEWQFCSNGSGLQRSATGGSSFGAPMGFDGSDRYNWCTPAVIAPSDHDLLLVGSHRVYRSTNNGLTYQPISPDLTTNTPASLVYSTITTLEIAASNASVYYVGTDDGRVWRTRDSGSSWTEISAGLPVRWVTRVTADPLNADVVYVTLSGFSQDETLSHVYRSTNGGDSWVSISGNLPNVPVNDLLVDPATPGRLLVATDVGVYGTENLGASWYELGSGLPLTAVTDLTLHAPTRTLVAATHGRSQWKLDLSQLVVTNVPPETETTVELLAPAPNPTRGAARVSFDLAKAGRVEVEIADVLGRRVASIFRGSLPAGRHSVLWDGRDANGRVAPAGVYYVRAALGERGARIKRLVKID